MAPDSEVPRFTFPELFNETAVQILLRRVVNAARTSSERRLFASVLRRAREDLLELEMLYRELPAVLGHERAAGVRFREVLDRAFARGVAISVPFLGTQSGQGLIPMPDFFPCPPSALILRGRIRLLVVGIEHVSRGNPRRRDDYVNTLRGLWQRTRLLERLYRRAVDGSGDGPESHLAKELRLIGREVIPLAPGDHDYSPGGSPTPPGGQYPLPDDGGQWPWPGPDDGPDITWPPGGPIPDGPGSPPGSPPLPGGGPPPIEFDPCSFVDDPCNQLALRPLGLPESAWAHTVLAVTPSKACAGEQVVISGGPFGAAQPADVTMMIGDQQIPTANIVSWTDSAITFTVPLGTHSGCVGFRSVASESARYAAFVQLSKQQGILNVCFGSPDTPIVPYVAGTPPCTGVNFFSGTVPEIAFFHINGGTDVVVQPGEPLVLTWDVLNTDSILITLDHPAGPQYGNNPPGTTLTLPGITATEPVDHVYYFHASNRCGRATVTATIRVRRIPSLKVVGMEVVQAIQHFNVAGAPTNNDVRLVARRRTIVRVYVDSGLTDFTYLYGTPNALPITGELKMWANPVTAIAPTAPSFGPTYALPTAAIDRDKDYHSLNFVVPWDKVAGAPHFSVRVWATGQFKSDPAWSTNGSLPAITFHPRRKLKLAFLFISNTFTGAPAPGPVDIGPNINHILDRYPLAEDGIEISVVPGTFANTHDLSGGPLGQNDVAAWTAFWNDVAEFSETLVHDYDVLIGLLLPTPGGVGGAAKAGHAWPEVVVAEITPRGLAAHELTHAFHITHAPCNVLPSQPIDPRLPGNTEETGINARTVFVIPKGTPDIMGYCTPSWPGAQLGDGWCSVALWNILFDKLA
jgi:hypothetical protein